MATMLYKTKGGASPNGKPRVYFTCHPEDFSRYFEKICADIFKTHDCAIYYTKDMTEIIPEEDKPTDLGSMNLFVVPVTFRMLTQNNRAMDDDLAYAKKEHIPILPFMMESGINEFYSKPDKFGELQYINPYSSDLTEISYKEKLKKYLESVLISEETAKRVRAAFDAYIFLSYRKKDRRYANELMRLIHAKPEFRDIAIWYDEFLTPGESFNENIRRMMKESKLFALLVTPNLLEKPDGKPNYVMEHEYPSARDSGMDILPAEMEATDKDVLHTEYAGIPECADPYDDEVFRERLLQSLGRIARAENDNDPEHNYLIGLAYLDGIDMETDKDRGIALITKAAEAELPEAMNKLFVMYREGSNATLDYRRAVIWAERLADYYTRKLGEGHPDTLTSLSNLASTYGDLGDHKKALESTEKVYTMRCRILGEDHPDTLISLGNLAVTYSDLGDHKKSLELGEKVYTMRHRILGEVHPDTLTSLSNLASTYGNLGDHKKALELKEKVYILRCRILGEEHPDTLNSLGNLAVTYSELGDHKKALELKEKVYTLSCKILGEEHPDTLTSLNNLAVTYGKLGNHKKALELKEKVYTAFCQIFGEDHPNTLRSLNNRASTYYELGDLKKVLELEEKAYTTFCRILGENHPDTMISLNNLATAYGNVNEYEKAITLTQKLYHLHCKVLGETHPNALSDLHDIAWYHWVQGDTNTAVQLAEEAYDKKSRFIGENEESTIQTLNLLSQAYDQAERYDDAINCFEKVLAYREATLGVDHADTIETASELNLARSMLQLQLKVQISELEEKLKHASEIKNALIKKQISELEEDLKHTSGIKNILKRKKLKQQISLLERELQQIIT